MAFISLRIASTIKFHGTEVTINEVQTAEVDDYEHLTRIMSYLVGVCEGVFSFLGPVDYAGYTLPIEISNYSELDDYHQMRARELLVSLSAKHDGREKSPVNGGRIKLKLDWRTSPPRVLAYQIEPAA